MTALPSLSPQIGDRVLIPESVYCYAPGEPARAGTIVAGGRGNDLIVECTAGEFVIEPWAVKTLPRSGTRVFVPPGTWGTEPFDELDGGDAIVGAYPRPGVGCRACDVYGHVPVTMLNTGQDAHANADDLRTPEWRVRPPLRYVHTSGAKGPLLHVLAMQVTRDNIHDAAHLITAHIPKGSRVKVTLSRRARDLAVTVDTPTERGFAYRVGEWVLIDADHQPEPLVARHDPASFAAAYRPARWDANRRCWT